MLSRAIDRPDISPGPIVSIQAFCSGVAASRFARLGARAGPPVHGKRLCSRPIPRPRDRVPCRPLLSNPPSGVEFGDILGAVADFDDVGLPFTNFNGSMGEFPFNGFRFILTDPAVVITDVQLVSTTLAGLDASYINFRPHGIAINCVFEMTGSLRLNITTTPVAVAVEGATWSAVKSTYRP